MMILVVVDCARYGPTVPCRLFRQRASFGNYSFKQTAIVRDSEQSCDVMMVTGKIHCVLGVDMQLTLGEYVVDIS